MNPDDDSTSGLVDASSWFPTGRISTQDWTSADHSGDRQAAEGVTILQDKVEILLRQGVLAGTGQHEGEPWRQHPVRQVPCPPLFFHGHFGHHR